MKKTWVKRENIYYKPFYKHKFKMLLLGIILLGITFFIYQAFAVNKLPSASTPFALDSTMLELRNRAINSNNYPSNSQKERNGDWELEGGDETIKIMRGIRLFDYDAYKPNFNGKFHCLDGSRYIPFRRVNDDYCDCLDDGSDEPSTNACANGKFYCKYQKRHITGRGLDTFISSSRINDGICDCCDGSDEWTTISCGNHC